MTGFSLVTPDPMERRSKRPWVDVLVLLAAAAFGVLIGLQLVRVASTVPIQRSDFESGRYGGRVRPSRAIAGDIGYLIASARVGVFWYGVALPVAFAAGFVLARDSRRGDRVSQNVAAASQEVRTASASPALEEAQGLFKGLPTFGETLTDLSKKVAWLILILILVAPVVLAFIGTLTLRDIAMIGLRKAGILPTPPHPIYIVGYLLWLALIGVPIGMYRLGEAFR